MKKIIYFCLFVVISTAIYAQDQMFIHKNDKTIIEIPVAEIDSMFFSNDFKTFYINKSDTNINFVTAEIDSITFGYNSYSIFINFYESNVQITNPFNNEGVSITLDGADVVVNSIIEHQINYYLSGNTSSGSFKIYSKNDFNLILNNANITNNDGPAINIQSNVKCNVILPSETINKLSDGNIYATSVEDQKATFFSEAKLTFDEDGELYISSSAKHALCSDEYIIINNGNIIISDAAKDGIHTNEHLTMNNGKLSINASADAIDVEEGFVTIINGSINIKSISDDSKGIKCDSIFTMEGGNIYIEMSGKQSKAIKAAKEMYFNAGYIEINNSGSVALIPDVNNSTFETSYSTAIKSDADIYFNGTNFLINSNGTAGKAISSDANIFLSKGNFQINLSGDAGSYTNNSNLIDSYSSTGITANGNITISNANINIISSAIAGKGISADENIYIGDASNSPIINITTSGERFLVSGNDYSYSKAIKADKVINIVNADIVLKTTKNGADAIDSDGALNISGGSLNITVEGNQAKGLKASETMNLSSGNIIINTKGGIELSASGNGYDVSYCTAIKCNNDISLSGSQITIISNGMAGKGISSDKSIAITNGNINISTNGAASTYKNSSGSTDSYKSTCLTADANINIIGGELIINSTGSAGKGITANGTISLGDNNNSPSINITTTGNKITVSNKDYSTAKAIKADGAITINNGTINISSADDGIKSETSVNISNANINISKSTEGIEAPYITVNSGNVKITASDDSFNATKGNGGEQNDGSILTIKGGTVSVNSTQGDGLDSNGNIVISGGTITVHGPQGQPEVGLDYNGTCSISGGLLAISGPSSNMSQGASSNSTQYSIKVISKQSISANTIFHIQDANGKDILTFKPIRNYATIVFSSPELINGGTYYIYTGGSSTGTEANGLYIGGTYSGGTQKKSFVITKIVNEVSL